MAAADARGRNQIARAAGGTGESPARRRRSANAIGIQRTRSFRFCHQENRPAPFIKNRISESRLHRNIYENISHSRRTLDGTKRRDRHLVFVCACACCFYSSKRFIYATFSFTLFGLPVVSGGRCGGFFPFSLCTVGAQICWFDCSFDYECDNRAICCIQVTFMGV